MKERLIRTADESSLYDFTNENRRMMIGAGLYVVERPKAHFLLNTLYLLCVLALHLFLSAVAVWTLVSLAHEKVFMEKTLHIAALLLVSLAILPVNHGCKGQLRLAVRILRRIQDDADHLFAEDYDLIKRKCVRQIKRFARLTTKLCVCNAFANTFLTPFIGFMSNKTYDIPGLNPYLPDPLLMPFDTTTPLGFCAAFLTNGAFVFFMNALTTCCVVVYISSALQLIAQMDILNHSLAHIHLRAYSKLRRSCPDIPEGGNERLYDRDEFQNWLYLCLRQNVRHHQSIIRLKEAMDSLWRPMNSIAIVAFTVVSAATVVNILENPKASFASIVTLVVETFCFYLACMVGEDVKQKSEEIINVLYSTPWPYCNKKFNEMLKIMIMKAQQLIILRAAGSNTPSSLETFSKVSSLGYKIVNVIRH